MKKLWLMAVLSLAAMASAQPALRDDDDSLNQGKVVSVTSSEWVERDGGTVDLDPSTATKFIVVKPNPGPTHKRRGYPGEYAWNYYAESHRFKWDNLEGRVLDVDQNDVPFRIDPGVDPRTGKKGCGNVLLAPRRTTVAANVVRSVHTVYRERTKTIVRQLPGEEILIPQYRPCYILSPQTQYVGALPPSTVVAPVVGGINWSFGGGTRINICNVNKNFNANSNTNNNSNANSNANSNSNTVNVGGHALVLQVNDLYAACFQNRRSLRLYDQYDTATAA